MKIYIAQITKGLSEEEILENKKLIFNHIQGKNQNIKLELIDDFVSTSEKIGEYIIEKSYIKKMSEKLQKIDNADFVFFPKNYFYDEDCEIEYKIVSVADKLGDMYREERIKGLHKKNNGDGLAQYCHDAKAS